MSNLNDFSAIDLNKLRTLEQLKGKIREVFTDDEIKDMVTGHAIPHYILTNPFSGKETILFDQADIHRWVKNNCLREVEPKFEQVLNFREFNHERDRVSEKDAALVPPELSLIKNLYSLPTEYVNTPPGVYFLCYDLEIVYIGQANNIASRICTHISENLKSFNKIFFIPVYKEHLIAVESALIRKYKPKYNQTCNTVITSGDMEIIESILCA